MSRARRRTDAVIVLVVPLLVAVLVYGGREALRRQWSLDLRRLAPLAGVAAVVAVVGGLELDGGSALSPLILAFGVVLAGLAFAPGPQRPGGGRGPVGRARRPDRADARAPSRGPAPSAAAVARALGRVEARELSRSPWFGVGVGFCVLVFVLFGFVWAAEDTGTWDG